MSDNWAMKTKLTLAMGLALLAGCGQNAPTELTGATSEPAPASVAGAEKIGWVENFQGALEQAKKENKPVLVDFYATWCGPCKMMDKQTYTDSAVAAEMSNWVSVKIDVDKHEALARQYKIESIPTTVLLGSDGKTISSTSGFLGPKEFVSLLSKARPAK